MIILALISIVNINQLILYVFKHSNKKFHHSYKFAILILLQKLH